MNERPATTPYTIAAVSGAALWIGIAIVSGKSEAWDSALYWLIAYPLTIVVAGLLGYAFPERAWRWALAAMLVQPVILAMTAAGFGLLPVGLILFAFLSLPAIGAAQLAAWLARRKQAA